jgi:hypothetical protein
MPNVPCALYIKFESTPCTNCTGPGHMHTPEEARNGFLCMMSDALVRMVNERVWCLPAEEAARNAVLIHGSDAAIIYGEHMKSLALQILRLRKARYTLLSPAEQPAFDPRACLLEVLKNAPALESMTAREAEAFLDVLLEDMKAHKPGDPSLN